MRKLNILILLLCFIAACSSHKADEDTHLYRILVGDKYGFMDAKGRIVIEPQFDEANLYFYKDVCFAKIGQKCGLIDKTGSFVVNFDSTVVSAIPAEKGLFVVKGWGRTTDVIDKNGKIIFKDIVDFPWRNGIGVDGDSIYAIKGHEWVITGFSGEELENQLYVVRINGDTIGEVYHNIIGFCNGLCAVQRNKKWGYIDWNGKLVIDTIYDDVRAFSDEGIARVKLKDKFLYINKMGKQLFSVDSTITGFHLNRAAVVIKGEKCLVNRKGERICNLEYDEIYPFCDDNMATVVKDGKAMKIDTMGNIVLATDYEHIRDFIGGIAIMQKREGFWGDKKFGYVDIAGNIVIEPIYNGGYWKEFENKDKEFSLRALASNINGISLTSYYDLQGNLIWQDIPPNSLKKELPSAPERKEFIEYYDTRMTELEPIEGIYYVTVKHYYQDRDNSSLIGTNGSESKFYAVVKNQDAKDFTVYCVDKPGYTWRNKFVQIGESNIFAIMADDDDVDKYSSEGRVTIEDPAKFDFQLDLGHNNYYNFYDTYEFIRDYPPMSIYEQLQETEWTGSGFAVANGYVVTSYHITNYAKTIRIKGVNGDMKKSYKGFVVASDKEHDISVIRIVDKDFEEFSSIPYSIGKTNVEVGDDIFVLGYPMTSTMGDEIKLTEGVISAASGYKGNESMYQISAAAQPGNSGGPLFNADGSVIGIVSAKHADAENVNYAIKISYLYSLINSSNLGINIAGTNTIKNKGLSGKVKAVKNFVYLIECSSK